MPPRTSMPSQGAFSPLVLWVPGVTCQVPRFLAPSPDSRWLLVVLRGWQVVGLASPGTFGLRKGISLLECDKEWRGGRRERQGWGGWLEENHGENTLSWGLSGWLLFPRGLSGPHATGYQVVATTYSLITPIFNYFTSLALTPDLALKPRRTSIKTITSQARKYASTAPKRQNKRIWKRRVSILIFLDISERLSTRTRLGRRGRKPRVINSFPPNVSRMFSNIPSRNADILHLPVTSTAPFSRRNGKSRRSDQLTIPKSKDEIKTRISTWHIMW